MIRNILLLSPIYPGPNVPKSATPVVHYFAKEWVKFGYNVKVVTCPSNFPTPILKFAKLFQGALESFLNCSIRTTPLKEDDYIIDNVHVRRLPVKKYKPHSRLKQKIVLKLSEDIKSWCTRCDFVPDVIIGHWVNPQAELMVLLKQHYKVPTCLIMHDSGNDFRSIYKNEWKQILCNTDIIGYRSDAIKREFEKDFGRHDRWFYCYSGIPKSFTPKQIVEKEFKKVEKFVFVGMLIKRKYPTSIINAIQKSDINDYSITYIGDGDQGKAIKKMMRNNPDLQNRIILTNRIPREEVQQHLQASDVFIMISKNETYGLVYLEAMAAGCITIASRSEGFDGIIKDGVNGFLCNAGDESELTEIINRINNMPRATLKAISKNAIDTAYYMTDEQMSKNYIENITKLITN